jgi:hypothetical protein
VMMVRSDFWPVTCFRSCGMRNSMLEAALRTENDQYLKVVGHKAAARKLQDVLSLRFPLQSNLSISHTIAALPAGLNGRAVR